MNKKVYKKYIAILCVAVLVCVMFASLVSCENSTQNKDREIVDIAGRVVGVKNSQDIKSIVALGTGALRLVTYMQADSLVTGVENIEKGANKAEFVRRPYNYVNYEYFQSASVATIGTKTEANCEAILALNPDVIFCSYNDDMFADLTAKIKSIPIVRIGYKTDLLDPNIVKSFDVIGTVLGLEARSTYLKTLLNGYFEDLNARTKDILAEDKPAVYVGGVSYAGAQGFYYSMQKYSPLALINANNIVDNLPASTNSGGSICLDAEFVHNSNIDVILIDTSNLALVKDEFNKASNSFLQMEAVKNGKVYGTISYNFYSTNIELAIATAYFAGKMIYPTQFADIDIASKSSEIICAFLGESCYNELQASGYGFIAETINLKD